jgi:exodeoxyribonuclease V alpha subunit
MQRFAHDASVPLPHDIVVVDETSMVALALLARLVEALRPDARLVLVGDPDQLESVELGAVLADLVAAGERGTGPLAGRVVRLVRGRRFGGASPVARLAEAVRRGDEETTLAVLREQPAMTHDHGDVGGEEGGDVGDDVNGDVGGDADTGRYGSVRFLECDDPRSALAVEAVRATVGPVLAELAAHARAGRVDEALAALARVRVLCAHRRGPFGVSTWNQLAEQWLTGSSAFPGRWYPGRPLLVTRNDPRLGLVNGHTGVVMVEEGRPVAVFATPGGLLPVVRLEPAQLDDVETAYATTIHKSQGSEYPAVVVILPPTTSPLVSRELLYTAVTRARAELLVVGSADAVRAAVRTPARRMSGLADALS